MKKHVASVILAWALILVCGPRAVAQVTSSLVRTSIVVPALMYVGVTNTSVTYPSVTATHYSAGSVSASATSAVTHKANITHTVNVKSNASTMSASGAGARTSKPASDLQVSVSGGAWNGLSTTDRAVVSSSARGEYLGSPTVAYRLLVSWGQDTPGTYTLGFTYTIVAN